VKATRNIELAASNRRVAVASQVALATGDDGVVARYDVSEASTDGRVLGATLHHIASATRDRGVVRQCLDGVLDTA
jgi:hypothetical protein